MSKEIEIDRIKPESFDITVEKQKPPHLFKKGQSGNPNGRPKGSGLKLTTLLKEYLEKIPEGQKEPYKDLFIKRLLKKALIDNDIQALKLIINYVDGLPKEKIDLTGDIGIYNWEGYKNDANNNNLPAKKMERRISRKQGEMESDSRTQEMREDDSVA